MDRTGKANEDENIEVENVIKKGSAAVTWLVFT